MASPRLAALFYPGAGPHGHRHPGTEVPSNSTAAVSCPMLHTACTALQLLLLQDIVRLILSALQSYQTIPLQLLQVPTGLH